MTTILDVLEKGASFLDKKGIAEPRLNMELMVAYELGVKRMDLYLRFDKPLDKAALASLREKLKKRSENVPLQHINKVVHFGNYEFYCDHRALIPRPEPITVKCLGVCVGVILIAAEDVATPNTDFTFTALINWIAIEINDRDFGASGLPDRSWFSVSGWQRV